MAEFNDIRVEAKGPVVHVDTSNGYEMETIHLTPSESREAARKLNEAADKAQENDENERRRKFREDRWGA